MVYFLGGSGKQTQRAELFPTCAGENFGCCELCTARDAESMVTKLGTTTGLHLPTSSDRQTVERIDNKRNK